MTRKSWWIRKTEPIRYWWNLRFYAGYDWINDNGNYVIKWRIGPQPSKTPEWEEMRCKFLITLKFEDHRKWIDRYEP